MTWLPGWNSITGAHFWSNFYFWASIVSLIMLGVTEVLSHRYSERHDELAVIEQKESDRQHGSEIARLHLDTASANERAAQADLKRIALQAKLAPRRLSNAQRERLIGELRGKIPTVYLRIAGNPETWQYGDDIAHALAGAGLLDLDPALPHGPTFIIDRKSIEVSEGISATPGVWVFIPPQLVPGFPHTDLNNDPLVQGLGKAGITVTRVVSTEWPKPPLASPDWKTVKRIVIICDKPPDDLN